jgi:tetratricopeptide (TPR) repeat protein
LLETVQGGQAAAARSLEQYASAHPWISQKGLDFERAAADVWAALMRNDGRGVLAAAGRLPDLQGPRWLSAKGVAHLLVKDYVPAEQELSRAIAGERNLSNPGVSRSRSPLLAILCHFHLGQVYEATGKRQQAVNEYQEFLSHFENSKTRLPQVAEARAALKRLL